ncbi:hypothetical protein BN1013_01459 [Candidatus Rubidus massiliensis]|nr:hypothetical protein BN1013_01459 [Candidatus Rubidus massiliensis]
MNELIEYILESKSSRLDLLDWSYRNNFNELFNLDTIHLIAKLRPDIEKISIAYIYPETLRNLQYLPNLKELYLEECVVIQEDWQEIVYLTNLQSLHIFRIEYIAEFFFLQLTKLANLHTLFIENCESIDHYDLEYLFKIFNLQSLILNNITWNTFSLKIFENIAKCKNLRNLEFLSDQLDDLALASLLPLKNKLIKLVLDSPRNDFTQNGFQTICKFKFLETLHLKSCNNVSDDIFECILNLNNLKDLSIRYCNFLNIKKLEIIGNLKNLISLSLPSVQDIDCPFEYLKNLNKLENLNVRMVCKSLTGIEKLKKIKKMILPFTSNIENLTILNSLLNLSELDASYGNYENNVVLNLFELSNISKLNLECNSFAGEFKYTKDLKSNLRYLNLNGCKNIKNSFLIFLSQITILEELILSDCVLISDQGISSIKKLKLKSLNLSNCELISDKSLKYLSENINLTYLNLSYCKNISDDGLKFLSSLFSLEEINLKWCERITDKGLEYLIHLPQIKTIQISGNQKKFSNEFFMRVKKLKPKLKILI